jgi:hypothetical protein
LLLEVILQGSGIPSAVLVGLFIKPPILAEARGFDVTTMGLKGTLGGTSVETFSCLVGWASCEAITNLHILIDVFTDEGFGCRLVSSSLNSG